MKVALCLSGLPKFFEMGFEYIHKNIIVPNNCDVFLHAWHDSDKVGQEYGGVSWSTGQDKIKVNTPKRILELYNPKYFQIEPQRYDLFPDNKTEKDYPETQGENISFANYSMFYSMYQAMELCAKYEYAHRFKYDAVIRCRFDAAPLVPVDLDRYEITNFTKEIHYADVCRNKKVISDWLFWSNSINMRYMSSAYLMLDRYVFDEKIMLCGEEILTYHMSKINCLRIPKPISLFLIRDSEFKNKSFGEFH